MIIQISVGSAMKSKCQVWYKPTGNGWIFPEAPFLVKCHHLLRLITIIRERVNVRCFGELQIDKMMRRRGHVTQSIETGWNS